MTGSDDGAETTFSVKNRSVPAVTAAEMSEVDRAATDEVGLHLLSMMENAGRGFAAELRERASPDEPITVAAGAGGNGGGGLVAARHLANAGRDVRVVLDRPTDAYEGIPARQLRVLRATRATVGHTAPGDLPADGTLADALVGYGLREAARGRVAELIERAPAFDRVVSLDVPSGVDATTGDRPGPAVRPDATLTLALPKTGLASLDCPLRLVDIGIPAGVFERAGIDYRDPFGGADRVSLSVTRD